MIYVDNAATTKISDSVFDKMVPYLKNCYGNPSSIHSFGFEAKRAIEHSREQVAISIGATKDEIIFTSGGTEGNNWIISAIGESEITHPCHIITTSIEHHSILNACLNLEKKNIEVTYLPVDSTGKLSVDDVNSAIRPNTKLVSIIFGNNEIGTIQPIKSIGALLKDRGILFHSDAVQVIGHIPIDVSTLEVDFLTASAHKFNGPKGVGFLYKQKGITVEPLLFGGKQEFNLRSGTENVAGIVGLGFALEECEKTIVDEAVRLAQLNRFTSELLKESVRSIKINSRSDSQLPGILNITLPGVSGEAMIHLLSLKGVYASTSSACSSGEKKPSHVLTSIGLTEDEAKSSIRISFGKNNSIEDARRIASLIIEAFNKLKG